MIGFAGGDAIAVELADDAPWLRRVFSDVPVLPVREREGGGGEGGEEENTHQRECVHVRERVGESASEGECVYVYVYMSLWVRRTRL